MNKLFLSGVLTKDVEHKITDSGFSISVCTVQVEYKTQSKSEKYDIEVTCLGDCADSISGYKSGVKIFLVGRLKQEKWEKEGNVYSKLKVLAESVVAVLDKTANAGNLLPGVSEEVVPF